MVRGGREKRVASETWRGRRDNGRASLDAAKTLRDLAGSRDNGNPIMAQAINAAIAFADALTIRFGGVQNTGDHARLTPVLQGTMGQRADATQMKRLSRILGRKDAAQYGHRAGTLEEARQLVDECERFAEWAEGVLATA